MSKEEEVTNNIRFSEYESKVKSSFSECEIDLDDKFRNADFFYDRVCKANLWVINLSHE